MQSVLAEINSASSRIRFFAEGGGLPNEITLHEFHRDTVVYSAPRGALSARLSDGRLIRPDARKITLQRCTRDGAEVLLFPDLPWCDEAGKIIPEFHLSLEHEIYPDGAFFTTAMFHVESSSPPVLSDFRLEQSLELEDFDSVRYAVFPGRGFQSADIQSAAPERYLPAGSRREFDGQLLTLAGFNAAREKGPGFYAEFFLESGGGLSGSMRECTSSVSWQGNSPRIVWNFQKMPTDAARKRPIAYRNRWGFQIAPPPHRRKLPPMCIYQYIDNYRHYPTQAELAAILDAGCELFVIHSNWRRDAKNGCTPYDPETLQHLVARCHERKVRVAVYMRGNEVCTKEERADWFSRFFTPDFDGLYMDYGSGFGLTLPPDEDHPGGSVEFRRHYRNLREIRKNIGERGIFISHTGPSFSALGMSLMDGYISGEGERGALLRSCDEYNYYTMTSAACGTLWSAAFPEYASRRIIPFLASSGQAPHSPLGVQFKDSPLAHPPVPGYNDNEFRPLWQIWKQFSGEEDVEFYHDGNSAGLFDSTARTGHFLMLSRDRRKALLVAGSFDGKAAQIAVHWEKLGMSPLPAWQLSDGAKVSELRADFAKYPAAGFYFGAPPRTIPAPRLSGSAAYEAELAGQKRLRVRKLSPGKKLLLRLSIDNSICTALEDSNYFDLFDNELSLLIDGEKVHTFDYLAPGCTTPAIDLTPFLLPDKHRIEIRTLHFGEPFYTYEKIELSEDGSNWDVLRYENAIDPDRSLLGFELQYQ